VSGRRPPTFNVLYLPGTVRPLVDFARSLADHSGFRFRLVANGCSVEEEAFLAERAAADPRLEFASLRTKTILPHGEALDRLFRDDGGDYFACIDSDIFARGPFLTEAETMLSEHAALFSGLPAWLAPEERVMPADFAFMSGRFSHTADGRCLGVSYCAMYRRPELERVMDRTGVTFRGRRWSDLSAGQRVLLSKMKLAKRRYDTIKLVNLMLLDAGCSLAMCPEPNLMHVGALSSGPVRRARLSDRLLARLREIVEDNRPSAVPRRRAAERETARRAFRRRRLVEDYFRHLAAGGAPDGGPAPAFPASVRQPLVEMGRELLALRRRYGA
jgi:hypothetical protein